MPSTSKKQRNFMAAAAHNPNFAKKAGIPVSVAKEFNQADKGRKFKEGGNVANLKKLFKGKETYSEELKASVAEIGKTLSEAKGGWQVLMVMGGLGAAFGSVVGWALEHFSGK